MKIYIVHGLVYDDKGNAVKSRAWGVYQDKSQAMELKEDLERTNTNFMVEIKEDYLV